MSRAYFFLLLAYFRAVPDHRLLAAAYIASASTCIFSALVLLGRVLGEALRPSEIGLGEALLVSGRDASVCIVSYVTMVAFARSSAESLRARPKTYAGHVILLIAVSFRPCAVSVFF